MKSHAAQGASRGHVPVANRSGASGRRTSKHFLALVLVFACWGGCASLGPDRAEYLVITPRKYGKALQPLTEARRKDGLQCKIIFLEDVCADSEISEEDIHAAEKRKDGWNGFYSERVRAAVRSEYLGGEGNLRYVLVVGASKRKLGRGEIDRYAPTSFVPLYNAKDKKKGRVRELASDNLFSDVDDDVLPDLAVGRLPVVSPGEVSAYVNKLLSYETQTEFSATRRSFFVLAGPACFGEAADRFIEQCVFSIMDSALPPAYSATGIYGKDSSPYCYPREGRGQAIVEQLCSGVPISIYMGHGLARSVRGLSTDDVRLHMGGARPGGPLFMHTCYSGSFSLKDPEDTKSRCLAAEVVLQNGGPVASFAASHISSAYINHITNQAFLEGLKSQPNRVGDLAVWLKREFYRRSDRLLWHFYKTDDDVDDPPKVAEHKLKLNHLEMYNLMGDPAARLKFPAMVPLQCVLRPASTEGAAARGPVLRVSAKMPFREGKGEVSFDNPLMKIPHMPDLMSKGPTVERWKKAHERKIVGKEIRVTDFAIETELELPADLKPGKYVVKLYAYGEDADAMGGTRASYPAKPQ